MKALSIVIPVYNTAQYLPRCLDSVLVAEALPYVELIAVNDGSTDRSADVLRDYQARYPENVVFVDKENGGHGSAVNAGLAAATGKYFRVLDSDDWLDSACFVKFLRALAHCDEDLIVTPYTQEYTYSGDLVAYEYDFFEHDHVYQASELAFDETMMYYTMASSTYKTALLRACGLKLYEKTFYVDMQFNIYPIPYLKTVRFLDYAIYRYFMGRPNQSMSQENLQRHLPDHQKVLRFLVEYYAAHRDTVPENTRDYMGLMIYFMYYTFMDLVCMKMRDRHKAYRIFKDFDRYLREAAPELYQRVDAFPYLHYSRKLGYLNIWLFNRLFVQAGIWARRLKGR